MVKITTLNSNRLSLQPASVSRAHELFPATSDPNISRFLSWKPHVDKEETAAMLNALARANGQGTAYHWIICEDDISIGIISLIDVRRTHRAWRLDRAEIAYWVAVDAQGKGYATEATRTVVDAAFSIFGLNRVIISWTTENGASGRIPLGLKFDVIGRETEFFCKDGVWHDMNHSQMTASKWADLQPSRS